jgi:hypothetical protein
MMGYDEDAMRISDFGEWERWWLQGRDSDERWLLDGCELGPFTFR